MTQYDDTNRGVLFKNDRKEKGSQPDYKGSINFDGTDYWLSAWIKESNGKKRLSLSVGDAKEKQSGGGKRSDHKDDLDDEIPF